MSNFTTTIRNICQTYAHYADTDTNVELLNNEIPEVFNGTYPTDPTITVDKCIEKAREHIFNFSYPFYVVPDNDEDSYTLRELKIFGLNNKIRLEHKILKHYYMREIGFETVGQFKLHLNIMLNDIMPKYNQMIYAQHLVFGDKFKVFDNINYTVETNENGVKENSGKTDNVSKSNNSTESNIYSAYTDSSNDTETVGSRTDIENTNDTISGSSNSTTNNENNSENTISENSENTTSKTTSGGKTNSKNGSKTTTTYGQPDTTTDDRYSDTPQGNVANVTGGYLTNYRVTKETKDYGSANGQNKNLHVKEQYDDLAETETYNNLHENNSEKKSDIKTGTAHDEAKSHTTSNNNEAKTGNKENVYGSHTDTSTSEYTHGAKNHANSKTNNSDDVYNYGSYSESNVQKIVKKISGKNNNKNYLNLIEELYSIINNIDMLIITELEPLFMGLWE